MTFTLALMIKNKDYIRKVFVEIHRFHGIECPAHKHLTKLEMFNIIRDLEIEQLIIEKENKKKAY